MVAIVMERMMVAMKSKRKVLIATRCRVSVVEAVG
jgi:hypothetical protein